MNRVEAILNRLRVLPIGADGGGNLFLMDRASNALGAVWKWDHEFQPRFDGVAREGLSYVAGSFVEFLERVAEDWEHFLAGDALLAIFVWLTLIWLLPPQEYDSVG